MPSGFSANRVPAGALPLPQYVASQGVLACLLLGSVFLLPRTTSFSVSPSVQTSLDRPSHQVLTPVTADPAKTMLCETVGASICMLWYAPSLRAWWAPGKSSDKEERVRETVKRIAAATASTLCAAITLVPVLNIFGASLEDHLFATLLLSLHLSFLSVWPVVYSLGPNFLLNQRSTTRFTVMRVFCEGHCESLLERALMWPVMGLLIGSVIGCVVLPLDWDRPWQASFDCGRASRARELMSTQQAYPLPMMGGSIIGYLAGGLCVMGSHGL